MTIEPVLELDGRLRPTARSKSSRRLDAALRAADFIVERTFRVGLQEQLYIEPQGIAQRTTAAGSPSSARSSAVLRASRPEARTRAE